MSRDTCKTFQSGDRVTVRRVIKSSRHRGKALTPGMVGVVDSMDQEVRVRFPSQPSTIWYLYDGDLVAVSSDEPSGEAVHSA